MSLVVFQSQIGVAPDGAFGPNTMKAAMNYLGLNPLRAAHFFAQVSHETGEFSAFSENLNYSTKGLLKTFGRYFPTTELASQYARKPEKIANRVYANRMGNGSELSGDGWKYRGRGALQLTGKANYQNFANHINRPEVMTNPDLVATELAFTSAIYFFSRNDLWCICDEGITDKAITALTKRINGGTNGLDHRKALTHKYYNYIK